MQRNLLKGTVLFALMLTIVSCTKKESNLAEPTSAIKIKSEVVKKVMVSNPKSYSATVEPEQVATIGFSVPGTVTGVFVKEGQKVQVGQQLAQLDNQEFSNAYQIATASYDQVVDLYNRFTKLYEKGSLPERDYLDIKTKLAQAKASKNISSKQLNDANLKASFSGVVTMKSVEKGMVIAPGQPLLTVANLNEVFAKINVPESEINQFKKGQQAKLYIASLQKEFDGIIDLVNPQADPLTRAYMVKVRIKNSDLQILGGMLGDVWLAGTQTEQIIIPASAVHKGENGVTNVYVLDGSSSGVIKKRVKVSNVRGANELVIQSGLEPGERLVIHASSKLYEGAAIVQ